MSEETFGQRLQRLRQGAGLSQPQLATAAGVPVASLRNWEQDRTEPAWSAVLALAAALGVDCTAFTRPVPEPLEKPRPGRPAKQQPAAEQPAGQEKRRGRPKKQKPEGE